MIALNVSSTTAFSARCSNAGATAASVVTNPSIVAMIGSIMPEPFAMPPTRNVPAGLVISAETSFGNGSVVMIARAASGPPSRDSARDAPAIPRPIFVMSSFTPITPVDATRTPERSQSSAAAVSSAIAAACFRPSGPVQAFAQPLLTTIAAARPADAAS